MRSSWFVLRREGRALRKRYEDEVVRFERDAYAKIARAVFAPKGTSAYRRHRHPAAFVRAVKGYMEDGKRSPHTPTLRPLHAPGHRSSQAAVRRAAALDIARPARFSRPLQLRVDQRHRWRQQRSPVVNTRVRWSA